MSNTKRRSAQLSVAAVAAFAIFAVAAVMLLAGSTPAQATNAALTPDDGAAQQRPQQTDPSPTPQHPTPEPCPGEQGNTNAEAARVVDSGHIALFDVYWNPIGKELTNNPCPPTVEHVPAKKGDRANPAGTPARDKRSPSNIDIETTIIHIPNSAKVDLNETGTPYPRTKYEDLWDADDKEDPNASGDGIVWALPACPPAGTPADDDLCIMFSAALLSPNDWVTSLKQPNGKIEYTLNHVHQSDTDVQDARYTLAYDVPAAGATGELTPHWDSSNVEEAKILVTPGEYERPTLFFTSRGTYQFQVVIQGYPNRRNDRADGLKPVSRDRSVSSDMREYIVHVGVEADLGVTAMANQSSPEPGDTVTVNIGASNTGQDEVPATGVDVTLPPGLTYMSHTPAGDNFTDDDGDGVRTWNTGSIAAGASKSLAITAMVDAGTRGKELAVAAAISGTENIRIIQGTDEEGDNIVDEYAVPVADTNSSNDAAAVTLTVPSIPNTDSMFFVLRSIAESSAPGTKVGDPVGVEDPNPGDTLNFSLTGPGEGQFALLENEDSVQIVVADGANLDYEVKAVYDLVLKASDGKDTNGNSDESADDTVKVRIKLIDIADSYAATMKVSNASPRVGEAVTLTLTMQNPPVPIAGMSYVFVEATNGQETARVGSAGAFQPHIRSKSAAGTYTYHVIYWHHLPDGTQEHKITSNTVTVTWSAQ